MQLEFTDPNQVSLERVMDHLYFIIKRPELFYPNFLEMSEAGIKNI